MNNDELRIAVEHFPMRDTFGIHIFTENSVCTNLIMETREQGYSQNPALQISWDAAQKLIDQLWNNGLRPRDLRYQSDALNMQNEHLKDMRKIAFKFLKIDETK